MLIVLVAVGAWLLLRDPSTGSDPRRASGGPGAAVTATAAQDPVSGLPYIAESELPAAAQEILLLIEAGGPFEFPQDGSVFGNYEGLLPDRQMGYYLEYTVQLPGESTRGAHRFVTGQDGEVYWTDDHYASFMVVLEDP